MIRMTSASLPARHVIGGHDRRGQQHPAHDRQLAGEVRRPRLLEEPVGEEAANEHADRGPDVRERGHQPRLEERHPAGPDQVRREPGDEEDLRRVAAELPERGAQDLPPPQQRADVSPAESHGIAPVVAARRPPRCSRARHGWRPGCRRDCDRASTRRARRPPRRRPRRRRARAIHTAARSRRGARLRKPRPTYCPNEIDPVGAGPLLRGKPGGEDARCWQGSTGLRRCPRRCGSG